MPGWGIGLGSGSCIRWICPAPTGYLFADMTASSCWPFQEEWGITIPAKVCSEICREFSTRCTFWAIGRDNILRKTNSVTLVATFYVHTSQFNLISLHRFLGGGDFSQIWVGWVAVGGQICLWEKGGGSHAISRQSNCQQLLHFAIFWQSIYRLTIYRLSTFIPPLGT